MVGFTLRRDLFLIRRDPNRTRVAPYSKLRNFDLDFIYFHIFFSMWTVSSENVKLWP